MTCMHVYLQQMHKLHETHPEVSRHFDQGLHVVRISDRFWAGLSHDFVIEQVPMRSVKPSGGLTIGRGMTETQRLVWLMANTVCAEANNAMQQLTGTQYDASEQHKYLTTARQGKAMADSCQLLEVLESRNPFFSDNCSLRSITTGMNAGISINVDTAKYLGEKILMSMAQQNVLQYSFKKKDQAVTLSISAVKVNNETIQIDRQLLFQRLITVGTRNGQLEEIFQSRTCQVSPSNH